MLRFDLTAHRGDWSLEAGAELRKGCVGLFGRSGAGKSSLIALLAGLMDPRAGTIELAGTTLLDMATGRNLPPHRRSIGVVFQDNRLFPHYNVEGNLRYGQKQSASGGANITFETVVDLLQLGKFLDRSPLQLSGGEQRRVALGRALLTSPDLLLLDEPLTGLDEPLKAQILGFLREIRDELGLLMVYVSHHLGDILQLTRELWVLDRGRLIGSGAYVDLVHDSAVIRHLLPLGLVNVLEMEIESHEPGAGCTRFIAPKTGARPDSASTPLVLSGPLIGGPVGRSVSLGLRPEDVALAASPVERISVRNQIQGRVRRHTDIEGRSIVEIDVGLPLIVEISTGSFRRLGLEPGREVWCLIKATALSVAGTWGSALD